MSKGARGPCYEYEERGEPAQHPPRGRPTPPERAMGGPYKLQAGDTVSASWERGCPLTRTQLARRTTRAERGRSGPGGGPETRGAPPEGYPSDALDISGPGFPAPATARPVVQRQGLPPPACVEAHDTGDAGAGSGRVHGLFAEEEEEEERPPPRREKWWSPVVDRGDEGEASHGFLLSLTAFGSRRRGQGVARRKKSRPVPVVSKESTPRSSKKPTYG